MVKPLHIEYPGAVYHLTARGNARNDVYRDQQNRKNYLYIPYAAHIKHGYTLKEVSGFLGSHYATVSRVMRKGEQEM